MILTDIHTHTSFSPDGRNDIEEMISQAKAQNIAYYGIAEHFDYDYLVNGLTFGGEPATYTDAEKYFLTGRAVQEREKGNLRLLLGCEFGYTANRAASPLYKKIIETYRPDFIVNSVHTNKISDYYYPDAYSNKLKAEAYKEYFDLVLRSTKADYPYDIIAHLGYCSRYAPYKDTKILHAEFKTEIDDILKEIVFRDKILEVNTAARGSGSEFLPDIDILARYYDFGGRNVSFASDAHDVKRIAEKRDTVVAALKEIGFTGVTVPVKGEYLLIPFDEN